MSLSMVERCSAWASRASSEERAFNSSPRTVRISMPPRGDEDPPPRAGRERYGQGQLRIVGEPRARGGRGTPRAARQVPVAAGADIRGRRGDELAVAVRGEMPRDPARPRARAPG